MRKIKLMALLLATLMVVAAFAGCAGVKKEELDALDVRVQALEDLLNGQQKDLEDIKNQLAENGDNSEILDAIESIKTDLEDKIKDVNDRVDDVDGKADATVGVVSDATKTAQQKALANIEVKRAAFTKNAEKYPAGNYEKISEALGTATGAVNAATTTEGVDKAMAALDAELVKYLTYQDMAYKYYVDLLGNVNADATDLVAEAKAFLKEVKAVYDEPVKVTGTVDLKDPYEDNEIEGYVAELLHLVKEGTSDARDQYIDMYNAVFVLCELYSGSAETTKELFYVTEKGKVDSKTLKSVAGYKKDAEDLVDVIDKVVGPEGIIYSQQANSNFRKVGSTFNKYENFAADATFLGGEKLANLVTNSEKIVKAEETVKLLNEAIEEFLKAVRVSAKKEADIFYYYDRLVADNAQRLLESDLSGVTADGLNARKAVWVQDEYEKVEEALADWVAQFELSEANKLAIISYAKAAGNTDANGVYNYDGTDVNTNYYGDNNTTRTANSYISDKHTNDLLVEAYNNFKTTIGVKIEELNKISAPNVTMVQLYEEIDDLYDDFFVLQEATTDSTVKYPLNKRIVIENVGTDAHQYDGSKNMIVIIRDSGIFDEFAEERVEILFDTNAGYTAAEAATVAAQYSIAASDIEGKVVIPYDVNKDGTIANTEYKIVDGNKNGEFYYDVTANGTTTKVYTYKAPNAIKVLDLYTFDSDRRTLELDRSANIKQIYFNALDNDDNVSTYLNVTDNRRSGDIYTFFVETYPAIKKSSDYINTQIKLLADNTTVNNNEKYIQLEGEYVKITTGTTTGFVADATGFVGLVPSANPIVNGASWFSLGNTTINYQGKPFTNADNVYVPVTDVYDREYVDTDGNKKDGIYDKWDANGNGIVDVDATNTRVEIGTHFELYLSTMKPVVSKVNGKPVEDADGMWVYTLKNAANGITYEITMRAFKEFYPDFVELLDLDVFEADKAAKAKLLDDLFAEAIVLVQKLDEIPYIRTYTVGSAYVTANGVKTPIANTVYLFDDENENGVYDAGEDTTLYNSAYRVNLTHKEMVDTLWAKLVAWRKLGGDHTLKRFANYKEAGVVYNNVYFMEGFSHADAIKVQQTGETIEALYAEIIALEKLASYFIDTVKRADDVHKENNFIATIDSNNNYTGNVMDPAAYISYYTWTSKQELDTPSIYGSRANEGKYSIVSKTESYKMGSSLNTTYDGTNTPIEQLAAATMSKKDFLRAAVGHYDTFVRDNVSYIGDPNNDYKTVAEEGAAGQTLYYINDGYAGYSVFDEAAVKYEKYDLIAVKGYLLSKLDDFYSDPVEKDHALTLVRSINDAKSVAEIERLIKSSNEEIKANNNGNRVQGMIVWTGARTNTADLTLDGVSIYDFAELEEVEARWAAGN